MQIHLHYCPKHKGHYSDVCSSQIVTKVCDDCLVMIKKQLETQHKAEKS